MGYTQTSIDRVREADIVQVVNHFVPLKKTGANYKAPSPFKEEKTPSFVVSPAKNIFKCFSTGIGGDAIKFVMEHKSLPFFEAIQIIAEICNIHLEEEEVSEEQKRKRSARDRSKAFLGNVEKKYKELFIALPKDHWVKEWINKRGYSQDILIEFGVGYTPGDVVNKPAIEKGYFETGKETGLIKVKNGVSYDAFKNRLMFPIHNKRGETIAFGGRRSDDEGEANYPKYINTAESDLYHKKEVLYGLHQAQNAIRKNEKAILVEGYTDVIALHDKGHCNAIASCGTAFTKEQARSLRSMCKSIVLFMDGDAAGQAAIKKSIPIILSVGLQAFVCVLPEKHDPDSLCQSGDIDTYLQDNEQDALFWLSEQYAYNSKEDPMAKSYAMENLAKILIQIPNEIARSSYIKKISSIFKAPVKELKGAVDQEAKINIESSAKNTVIDTKGLPDGADQEQYIRDRFAIVGNVYFFNDRGFFFKGSNFKLTPLFHIAGKSDNKRLCEVVNELGHKSLIDFESRELNSFTKFEDRLVEEGYYTFDAQTSVGHFKLLKNQILRDFIKAHELRTLGWQHERFFAFADGVFDNGHFKEVNKYGIVQIEREGKDLSEYQTDIKHYYSPAFSEIYKASREGDDPYENDRFFIYKKSPVRMLEWSQQLVRVYGDRGRLAVAFAVASIFRDHIIQRYGFFPHLFLSGEKGSGKSKYGDSIVSMFTYKLPAFDLNSGTLVGFFRRLARIKNIPVFLEEFNDKIHDQMFQGLKAAYDGRGREKGSMTTDNRTMISKVNSSCIIAGQYLSSRDDNSLTSRSIVQHFVKRDFTGEDTTDYDTLKDWENKGLSSMILEVLQHQLHFEELFHKQFAKNVHRFKKSLENDEYQERMLMNYNALFTPLELLSQKMEFDISMKAFYQECVDGIIANSDLIIESEGLAEFWKILEYLEKTNVIVFGRDYDIDVPHETTINPKKNETTTFKNTNRDKILFLRLNVVHQEYHKEVSRRESVDVIGEATIRNYFKSKKYFVGPKKAHRFDNSSSSCYLFNLTFMENKGVLSLMGDSSKKQEIPEDYSQPKKGEVDLPF